MHRHTIATSVCARTFALTLILAAPATVAAETAQSGAGVVPTPAWDAFKKADASIKDYTETVTTHEIKDGKTQDRVYHFLFAKPTLARSEIVSGPGSGGEAVWRGGDHVRGHQGGFLRGIKVSLSIDDPRVTDLLGRTIDAAFFPSMIASFESGKRTEEAGPVVAGVATDAVTLTPADPVKTGVTKDVILLSRATHLPVEHLGYQGAQLIEDAHFTDQKINPGLPDSSFDM